METSHLLLNDELAPRAPRSEPSLPGHRPTSLRPANFEGTTCIFCRSVALRRIEYHGKRWPPGWYAVSPAREGLFSAIYHLKPARHTFLPARRHSAPARHRNFIARRRFPVARQFFLLPDAGFSHQTRPDCHQTPGFCHQTHGSSNQTRI